MVLDASLLNTQHYKVRIKGKVEQSRERSSAYSKLSKREPSGHPRLWSPTLLTYIYTLSFVHVGECLLGGDWVELYEWSCIYPIQGHVHSFKTVNDAVNAEPCVSACLIYCGVHTCVCVFGFIEAHKYVCLDFTSVILAILYLLI